VACPSRRWLEPTRTWAAANSGEPNRPPTGIEERR
jgi:hypothetical protein